MRVVSEALVLLVRVYQWTLRPFIGAHCRFEPSCSHYAVAALRAHGAMRGSWLSAGRVLRCNPWHAGGHDPVPGCDCAVADAGGAAVATTFLSRSPRWGGRTMLWKR